MSDGFTNCSRFVRQTRGNLVSPEVLKMKVEPKPTDMVLSELVVCAKIGFGPGKDAAMDDETMKKILIAALVGVVLISLVSLVSAVFFHKTPEERAYDAKPYEKPRMMMCAECRKTTEMSTNQVYTLLREFKGQETAEGVIVVECPHCGEQACQWAVENEQGEWIPISESHDR